MAQKCSICSHPERVSIDEAIISGQSNRSIASQYGMSVTSVRRHRDNHLPEHLAKAKEAEVVTRADDLLSQTRDLLAQAKEITGEARTSGDLKTALLGIGKVKDLLELLLKVTGELESTNTVNITINPQFQKLQVVLLRELEEYPAIRQRVVTALQEVSG